MYKRKSSAYSYLHALPGAKCYPIVAVKSSLIINVLCLYVTKRFLLTQVKLRMNYVNLFIKYLHLVY